MPECPECGTELTGVRSRRGVRQWWCWKCEEYRKVKTRLTADGPRVIAPKEADPR